VLGCVEMPSKSVSLQGFKTEARYTLIGFKMLF
jgi:hypothetical protein